MSVRDQWSDVVHAQIGRLDTGKDSREKGKPRKASNIVTAKEERVRISPRMWHRLATSP